MLMQPFHTVRAELSTVLLGSWSLSASVINVSYYIVIVIRLYYGDHHSFAINIPDNLSGFPVYFGVAKITLLSMSKALEASYSASP